MKGIKRIMCTLFALGCILNSVSCSRRDAAPDVTSESTDTPVTTSAATPAETEEKPQNEQLREIPDYTYGYFGSSETLTAYTGDELKIELDDPKYGGPQFVAKLFTEGMGRAPKPEEYIDYTKLLESEGCTLETLSELADKLFSSEDFLALSLEPEFEAIAVYRAILSRDPSRGEAAAYITERAEKSAAEIALSLILSDEFKAMLPDIIAGPYFWGKNNSEYSPSGNIMTSDELQTMLFRAKGGTLELEPGTLVIITNGLALPKGTRLTTKGSPSHYSMKARFLRMENNTDSIIGLTEDSVMTHIWVDGNRLGLSTAETRIKGQNIVLGGDNSTVTHCRTNGATAGTQLYGADSCRGLYIAHNMVTCYDTVHENNISDGITHAATESIIEYNEVVDATDVGIIVFRFVSDDSSVPQNTVVRKNIILNAGNSAYAGLDIDAWHSQGATQNFTGTLFEDNILWTSYRAHHHICLSLAPLAWTNIIGDHAIGSTMINNYTPEGLRVLCAAAMAVDGVTEAIMRGNHLDVYIGPWGRSYDDERLAERLVSLNESTSSGDIQGGYENKVIWLDWLAFVNPHPDSPLKSVTLRHAIVHEDRVSAAEVGHPAP